MQQTIPRPALVDAIKARLRQSPAVSLLGARQVGKTTLARMVAEDSQPVTFFDLELPSGRRALETSAEQTLRPLEGLVVIDEVQRLPFLFELLRPLCDAPDRRSKYLLLGSANPFFVRGVSESLAGRVLFVPVPGLSLPEVGQENQERLWLRGGFPLAYLAETDGDCFNWLESFQQSFLQRDISELGIRVPASTLGRFWMMLAHYHGQNWNAAEIARTMDVSAGTVNHYRDVLEGTYMLRVLQPWFENIGKRQTKSPKIYLRDSGQLHQLLRIQSMLELRGHPRYGASWEGLGVEHVLSRFGEGDAYFWGTQRGAELDLLIFRHGKRWGFEFKGSDAPNTTKSMHVALQDLGLEHLWVIYPGTLRYALTERITALPLRDLRELDLVAGSRWAA
jgi:uncharacterized protein